MDLSQALRRTRVAKAYSQGYIIHVSSEEGRDRSTYGVSIQWYDHEPTVNQLFLPLDEVKRLITATCGDVFDTLQWQSVRPK